MAEEFPSSDLRQKHAKQLMKTEMCKFFLANKCGKGVRCAFAHSFTEIKLKPNLERTSMCSAFLQTGNCDRPNCKFAHDERELRTTTGFFKTKLCRFAASGRCKHGAACRFAHNSNELSIDPNQADADPSDALTSAQGMHAGRSRGGQPDGARGDASSDQRDQASGRSTSGRSAPDSAPEPQPATGGMPGDWADIRSDQGNREGSSEQSTRDATSASVPTPEGSGDSGQEEHLAQGARAGGRRNNGERRAGERLPSRHCTTMMLTNVPNFLTQGALVSLLEDLTVSMRGVFDFFYCPWDPLTNRNLGYAILNFFSRSVAAAFERRWSNEPLLPGIHANKRLRIVPAALQGRAANLRHFSGFTLAHHADPRFRPLVRAGPHEALRPMAISEELIQANNQQHNNQPPSHHKEELHEQMVNQGDAEQRACAPSTPAMQAFLQDINENMMQPGPQQGQYGMMLQAQHPFGMLVPQRRGPKQPVQGQQCWLLVPPDAGNASSAMGMGGMSPVAAGDGAGGPPVPYFYMAPDRCMASPEGGADGAAYSD